MQRLKAGHLITLIIGYCVACGIGALGVTMVMGAILGKPGPGAFGNMLVVALIGCLPTYVLGRFVMFRNQLSAARHHALLWAIAGTVPVLVLGVTVPQELTLLLLIMMIATMSIGCVAGLAAYWIEVDVRPKTAAHQKDDQS